METYIIDSFTNQKFKGNPAGVCIPQKKLPDELMLIIAQELNLSETAFIQELSEAMYSIRFFSPKMEIPLCGHATLAASRVIFDTKNDSEIEFQTIEQKRLRIIKKGELIEMEFPVYTLAEATVPNKLLQALGISSIKNAFFNKETNILMLEVENTDIVKNVNPNFQKLYDSHQGINGVLITAKSDDGIYDFHSRYFWPWSGTNEDPVTGGTHTFLAKYWADKLHKKRLKSFQSSNRTGFLEVELTNDNTVLIRGNAVIVFKGELML